MKHVRNMLAVCLLLLGVMLLFAGCSCRHEWQDATCTAPATCRLCGETEGEAATDHQYHEEVREAATCGKEGTKVFSCKHCEETYTESIAATDDHKYQTTVTETPACREGTKTFTCSVCGDSYTEAIPASAQHTYKSYVQPLPTCEKEGARVYTCSACGHSYSEVIPPLASHSYTSTTQRQASCWQSGIIRYTCSVCRDSYIQEYTLTSRSADQLQSYILPSIAQIVSYDRQGKVLTQGTCFVYEADGKFITAYHLIAGASSAKIFLGRGEYDVTAILAYDVDADLTVVDTDVKGLTPVTICTIRHSVGKRVYAVGTAQGITATVSEGAITYADRQLEGIAYVQHNAAFSDRYAGGPLINEYGEVIGILTTPWLTYEDMPLAVSVGELDHLDFSRSYRFAELPDVAYPTPEPDTEPDTRPKDGYAILTDYLMQYHQQTASGWEFCIKQFVSHTGANGNQYSLNAVYFPADGVIHMTVPVYVSEANLSLDVRLLIDNNRDGYYQWEYRDSRNNNAPWMYGYIKADTYTEDVLLSSTVNSLPEVDKNYYRRISSVLVAWMCHAMDESFASLDIGVADFGFVNF